MANDFIFSIAQLEELMNEYIDQLPEGTKLVAAVIVKAFIDWLKGKAKEQSKKPRRLW